MGTRQPGISWISERFDRLTGSNADMSACRAALSALDVCAVLRSALTQAHTDADHLTDACHRSYEHPNGFVKLRLAGGRRWALRLHLWSAEVPADRNDPHDHCGFLVSRIVSGGVRNDEYAPSSGPGSVGYLRYRDQLADSVHRLTEAGTERLTLLVSAVYGTDDTYLLDGNVIHRTSPRKPFPTVTLVLEGPHTKAFSTVYRTHPRPDRQTVRINCTPHFFLRTIEVTLQRGWQDSPGKNRR